ncbi:hypothetical protein LQ50_21725 [Halalkalibacter okhensis]|uniref:Uncharacterized protein n=1 Tax=Halalkalibacter okhensis TaxID=333138 RepID=A0A0B0IE93_9BACI|nr:hypothetical protein LQ50_21725 [Halalkalibacter okhensis]
MPFVYSLKFNFHQTFNCPIKSHLKNVHKRNQRMFKKHCIVNGLKEIAEDYTDQLSCFPPSAYCHEKKAGPLKVQLRQLIDAYT